MGNKISTVLDAIQAGLETISGLTVVRRAVVPFKEKNLPIAGIIVSGSAEEADTGSWEQWNVEVLVGLLLRKGEVDQDVAALDLAASAIEAIKKVNDSNAPGGVIDRPRFSLWHHVEQDKPLALVGAAIEIRVRVDGPLVTA